MAAVSNQVGLCLNEYLRGFKDISCKIGLINEKFAVLLYMEKGETCRILCYINNVYYNGSYIDEGDSLVKYFEIGDALLCDAVPVLPQHNPYQCTYGAVVVWRHTDQKGPRRRLRRQHSYVDDLAEQGHCPSKLFLKCVAKIKQIVDEFYAILWVQITPNYSHYILMHREFLWDDNTHLYDKPLFCSCREGDSVLCLSIQMEYPHTLQDDTDYDWSVIKAILCH